MLDEARVMQQYAAEIDHLKARLVSLPTEIKNLETQRDHLIHKARTLNKFEGNGVKTRDDVEELIGILCWKSLAYCCLPRTSDGQGKKCMWRDAVLKILGITDETFMDVKEKSVEMFSSVDFTN